MHGIFPLMIFDRHRTLVATALQSPKAFQKSLEQGEIWAVHPDTLRVLPVQDTKGLTAEFISDRSEIVLPEGRSWTGLPPTDPAGTPAPEAAAAEGESGKSTGVLESLTRVIHQRNKDRPEGSYTTHLFQKGEDKIRKKVGEEAVELVLARTEQEIISEAADLVYHLLVLFEAKRLPLDRLLEELNGRMK